MADASLTTAALASNPPPSIPASVPPPSVSAAAMPAAGASRVKVGDKVWYVPAEDHELDEDHTGGKLFIFEFAHNRTLPQLSYQKGQRVENFGILGRGRWRRNRDGQYITPSGAVLQARGPAQPWPALVRQVFSDGTVALDIAHPLSASLLDGHGAFDRKRHWTLHYPKFGATGKGVPYDASGETLHSWHLLTDAAGGN